MYSDKLQASDPWTGMDGVFPDRRLSGRLSGLFVAIGRPSLIKPPERYPLNHRTVTYLANVSTYIYSATVVRFALINVPGSKWKWQYHSCAVVFTFSDIRSPKYIPLVN